MTDKEVMRQALDALLGYKPYALISDKERGSAIIALREAIAKPVQLNDSELLNWISIQDLDELSFALVKDAEHDGEICIYSGSKHFYGATLRDAVKASITLPVQPKETP